MGKRNRRQKKKQQPASHQGRRPSPQQQAPSQSIDRLLEQIVRFPFVTDDLVHAVLARGGAPERFATFEALKGFLEEAFVGNPILGNFFLSLAKGLELGQPIINQHIPLADAWAEDRKSLLQWICQYRFLNSKLRCNLSDDMVELVLQAGAFANEILPNGTNALFFAVKYTSVKTVDLLLEAGTDIQQRDQFRRSCLYNALEYPHPSIIRRLLDHLPASDMFEVKRHDLTNMCISAADAFLAFIAGTFQGPLISWMNLGNPQIEDLQETFIIIRQRGARFTEEGSRHSIKLMGYSVSNPDHPQIPNPELLRELSKTFVAIDIPRDFKPTPEEGATTVSTPAFNEEKECPICLDGAHQAATLYCGHTFCRTCIVEYGQKQRNNGCPVCRAQLCRDLVPADTPRIFSHHQFLGLERATSHRQGPKYFTNEQLIAEAKAQGIYSMSSSSDSIRSSLESALESGYDHYFQIKPLDLTLCGESTMRNGQGQTRLDLCSNVSIVGGSPPSRMSICPTHGPVGIEISINGIPLLAHISNHSMYTIFNKSAVDQLGLKRIEELTTREFVDILTGEKIKNSKFTCLDPVGVDIGGIKVTLRNAVEMSPDSRFMFGVLLGQDFLFSGLLTVIDAEIGDRGAYYRTVGEASWPTSNISKESFRYYAHDGKMASLPLIHFDPFRRRSFPGMSLKDIFGFQECSWCCRLFPAGMKRCGPCSDYGETWSYCDDRCQKAAWKIHKMFRPAHQCNRT